MALKELSHSGMVFEQIKTLFKSASSKPLNSGFQVNILIRGSILDFRASPKSEFINRAMARATCGFHNNPRRMPRHGLKRVAAIISMCEQLTPAFAKMSHSFLKKRIVDAFEAPSVIIRGLSRDEN